MGVRTESRVLIDGTGGAQVVLSASATVVGALDLRVQGISIPGAPDPLVSGILVEDVAAATTQIAALLKVAQ